MIISPFFPMASMPLFKNIEKNLLQLGGITKNMRQGLRILRLDVNVEIPRFILQKINRVIQYLIDTDHFVYRFHPAGKTEESMGNLSGPLHV